MANAFSGVTQYVLQNWRFIDKERFQFDFATLSKTKLHFEDEVSVQGCKVHYISCYAEDDKEQFTKEIKQILLEGEYDVVHLHTSFWKSFLVEEISKEIGIPKIIVHAHNTNVLGESNREEQIAQHNRCVDALDETIATDFWACSWAAAEWLYGNRISKDKIVIQKNAIDIDRFRYNAEVAKAIKAELGWDDCYVIGHVGRFTYQKNHEFLLRVFREVHEKNPRTRLLLVGIGPEREKIETMVYEWSLQNVVQILEKRSDVNCLMQAMDCFAFPSRFEGLGLALVEAQAAGCACLASETIPSEAFLTDSVVRLPLIEKKWIDTILFISKSTKQCFIENADQLCVRGYDLKVQIKKIEDGYSQ